jgi:hypothetical protein
MGTDGTADGAQGLVPAPTTADANKYLSSAGTWETMQGGGGSNLILDAQIYSTDEKQVGVWLNNKPLYQKTYIAQSPVHISNSGTNINNMIDNNNIIEQISNAIACNSTTSVQTSNIQAAISGGVKAYCAEDGYYDTITLWYTKTTDAAGSGGYQAYGFSPIIYSETEREIGVWIDNKPLYAKTVTTNGSVPSGAVLISREVINANYDLILYTKSSDTAGSGSYNTLGVPNVHYSTDEQVIGTWMGETLYQKCVATGGSEPSGATLVERTAMASTGYDTIKYIKS